jgi:hypothetical protein
MKRNATWKRMRSDVSNIYIKRRKMKRYAKLEEEDKEDYLRGEEEEGRIGLPV